jgi:hypothetical protein
MQKREVSRKSRIGWFSRLALQAKPVVLREANQSYLSEFRVITLELPVLRQVTEQTVRLRLQVQADEIRALLGYT